MKAPVGENGDCCGSGVSGGEVRAGARYLAMEPRVKKSEVESRNGKWRSFRKGIVKKKTRKGIGREE